MTMNMRGHVDMRRYSPSRDIAYSYRTALGAAFEGLEEDKADPFTARFLRDHGVTEDQIGDAAVALARYYNIAAGDPELRNPFDALKKCGFLDLPSAVQLAVMARVGQVMTGMAFMGVREVQYDNEPGPADDDTLLRQASAFRRRLSDWYGWRRVTRRWRNFTGAVGRVFFRPKD